MTLMVVLHQRTPGVGGAGSGFGDLGTWWVALLVVLALGGVAWWARGSRRRR